MGSRPSSELREVRLRPLEFCDLGRARILPRRPHPDVAVRPRVRPARPQGFERIDDERKRLEIDLNFLDRFGGREFVDGGHRENRFALVQRLHW